MKKFVCRLLLGAFLFLSLEAIDYSAAESAFDDIDSQEAVEKVSPIDSSTAVVKNKPAAWPQHNELGRIPILEYHHIGGKSGRWNRSAQQFKDDLLWLYNNDYVSISLQDFIDNKYAVPYGKKPVILTFDDGLISQFQYLSNGVIDPRSAIGIMDNFYREHPDFGRAAIFFVNESIFGQQKFVKKKLEYLYKTGREIGFHTLKHTNLKKQSAAQIKKILIDQARALASVLPAGVKLNALAYPFGGVPKAGIYTTNSVHENGAGYDIKLALLVGAEPAYPLYYPGVDIFRIPRIQAIDDEWLRHFGRKPNSTETNRDPASNKINTEKFTVFISDGDPNIFTFLSSDKKKIEKSVFLKDKNLRFIEVPARQPKISGINIGEAAVDKSPSDWRDLIVGYLENCPLQQNCPRPFFQSLLSAFLYPKENNNSFEVDGTMQPSQKVGADTEKFAGIYLTAYTAGSPRGENMLNKLKESGGNMVVVDFKEVDGRLYYPTTIELNKKYGGNGRILFSDPKKFIDFAHQIGFHVVGRIVCFKDKLMAKNKPEWAIHDVNGHIWKSPEGQSWLDPSLPEVQDYILEVAKEAANFGADEVQFDYVRFPTEGAVRLAKYNFDPKTTKHFEVIRDFLKKARETAELKNISLGIDVYGIVAWHDEYDSVYTGQKIGELAKYVDVIYPMIYPSHFGPGFGGHKNPADEPYFFVKESLRLFQNLLIEHDNVELRPWLQGFTYRVSRFGPDYIKKQIEAIYDSGLDSYAVWNAGNRYDAAFAGMRNSEF